MIYIRLTNKRISVAVCIQATLLNNKESEKRKTTIWQVTVSKQLVEPTIRAQQTIFTLSERFGVHF